MVMVIDIVHTAGDHEMLLELNYTVTDKRSARVCAPAPERQTDQIET